MVEQVLTLDRAEELGDDFAVGLGRVDSSGFGLEEIEHARKLSFRLRGVLDVFDIDLARRARELRPAGGSSEVDEAMNPGGRAPSSKEKTDTSRGEIADAIPSLDDALRDGALDAAHLDAVASARAKLSDAERADFDQRASDLAAAAARMTLHQFSRHVRHLAEQVQEDHGSKLAARQRRDRNARMWDDILTGMRKLSLTLDPETGARVHDAIHAQVERLLRERRDNPADNRTMEQVTADAIADLILNGNQSLRPGSTELVVLVDLLTLTNGLHDKSVHETWDGTHLTPDTIRRIACDTQVIPIVMGGPSEILDVGRRQRTANREQRRALRAIYGACAFDRCATPFHRCDVHHIVPWWQHGDTDLANLIPLCSRHHHMVHESGWRLTLDSTTRQLTIHHPNGRVTIQPPPAGLAPPQPSGPVRDDSDETVEPEADDRAPDDRNSGRAHRAGRRSPTAEDPPTPCGQLARPPTHAA